MVESPRRRHYIHRSETLARSIFYLIKKQKPSCAFDHLCSAQPACHRTAPTGIISNTIRDTTLRV